MTGRDSKTSGGSGLFSAIDGLTAGISGLSVQDERGVSSLYVHAPSLY